MSAAVHKWVCRATNVAQQGWQHSTAASEGPSEPLDCTFELWHHGYRVILYTVYGAVGDVNGFLVPTASREPALPCLHPGPASIQMRSNEPASQVVACWLPIADKAQHVVAETSSGRFSIPPLTVSKARSTFMPSKQARALWRTTMARAARGEPDRLGLVQP